jgi:hypothetical protein
MSLAIWGDETGDNILIGDEDCKEGDPVIVIPITHDNVIAWIRALTIILDDGEIQDLPGEMGKCINVA